MLSTVAFLIALAAGANAQAQNCTAPNDVEYQFCGSIMSGEFNLYWNYNNDSMTLSLLYSARSAGWHALGFPEDGAQAGTFMLNASVVPGCITFTGDQEIPESPVAAAAAAADWHISARAANAIGAGGDQGLTEYNVGEVNGECWVRFVRPFTAALSTAANITGESQRVLAAFGGATFGPHNMDSRGAPMINFADGTGVDPVAPRGDGDDDDDAASALSMAATVPALVVAVVALWQ